MVVCGVGCGLALANTGVTHRSRLLIRLILLNMFARTSRVILTAKRCMSTSPRMTIAQNIVAMSEVVGAKSEAAVTAAQAPKEIDVNALPTALAGQESYLAAAAVAGEQASVVDESAWHNKSGMDFVLAEAGRESTWPFLTGLV